MAFARALRVATAPAALAPGGKRAFVQAPITVATGGRLLAPLLRWGAAPPTGKEPALLVAHYGSSADVPISDYDPFNRFMKEDAIPKVMGLFSKLMTPAHLAEETMNLKTELKAVMKMVTATYADDDAQKLFCAVHLLRCACGAIDLIYKCYPNHPRLTPLLELHKFVILCLAPDQTEEPQMWGVDIPSYSSPPSWESYVSGMTKADAELMRSVSLGVDLATAAATIARN